ncbi:hypothetical protein [Streptomyces sp. Wb2n-11]|uniref:hypothetical protein n=1 Tax=Streptomyces sp. Wb2n-11 TaxID=1030533 RepID=UPI000A570C0F|nr:hypothetical protein [Streptomyces sp. Wb2n-11]
MSVYGSIPGVDAEEECGPPWVYLGSHILPADEDPRGGQITLAEIPSHITRDGRDDQPEDGVPWPWLRVSVDPDDRTCEPTILLNPKQARHLADQLTAWADSTECAGAAVTWTPPPPGSTAEQLPDDVLALLLPGRYYLSTACQTSQYIDGAVIRNPEREDLPGWSERMHARCRLNHKFTGTLCACHCHRPEGEQ